MVFAFEYWKMFSTFVVLIFIQLQKLPIIKLKKIKLNQPILPKQITWLFEEF